MPNWSKVVKQIVSDSPELAKVLHLGSEVHPEIIAGLEKQLPEATMVRLNGNGAFNNGSVLRNNLEAKFGKDEAKQMLKQAGVESVQSKSSPGRNLLAATGLVGAMGATSLGGNNSAEAAPKIPYKAILKDGEAVVKSALSHASGEFRSLDTIEAMDPEMVKHLENFENPFYVQHLEAQQKGLGKKTLETLEKFAKKNGADVTYLNASPVGGTKGLSEEEAAAKLREYYKANGYNVAEDQGSNTMMWKKLRAMYGAPAAAALPALSAQDAMNPFSAGHDLGQQIKPVVDAYEGAKSAAANALTGQMNFGHDPEFQKTGTAVFSNALDPVNAIPGAPGVAAQALQALPNFASGGEVPDMKEFKVVGKTRTHTVLEHPDGHQIHVMHNAVPKKYAEGGAVDAPAEEPSFMTRLADKMMPQPAAPTANALNPQAIMPDLGQQPQNVSIQDAGGAGAPAAPSMLNPMEQPGQQPGMADMQAGIQNMAKATAQQGNAELQAAQEQQARSQSLEQMYGQKLQDLDSEHQAIMHDIGQGHIDPNHYTNSMSTGNKIGTAIGLILGGFGANGKNPAMEYLQKQIDNDIMAQKADLGKKENLLSANIRQYGNLHDAMAMTKAVHNDIYAAKIMQAAASAKSPQAQAAAQQAIGQLKAQNAPLLQQVAQRQTTMEALNKGLIDPAQAVPALVPKEHQKAVYEEIQKAQDASNIQGQMLAAFERARTENTVMRTGAGLFRTPAPIMEIQAMAMPLVHDAAGRVNEAELEMVAKLAPAPGDSESKIKEKRAGMLNFINAKKSAPTARSFGLDLSKLPTTNRAPSKWKPGN